MRLVLALSGVIYLSALAVVTAQQPAPAAALAARFDMEVRTDFFAGFSGDAARLQRGMEKCEAVLAADPNHAEALVWHGSGLLGLSGAAFQVGDFQKGGELWARGQAEVNRAVSLAPDSVGVRIPRGATLFEASRQMPDPKQREALVRTAIDDFEHTLQLQQATFANLSDHAKGELLFGLADGWARLGEKEKAKGYFARLTADAATSGRVDYAKAWLNGTPPANPGRCTGCH
jgi:tetratricopeptide (TPR) repeat protein